MKDTRNTSGKGGERHQVTDGRARPAMTTNQGLAVADNQNSLKAGARGPSLLEDFILREKITHFDHERIPERVVHARGAGAHGFFECTKAMGHVTRAGFLSEVGKKTEVFTRFSTVVGSKGSTDLARDVRGFATKFYTDEGVFDLVGNNIPVFFIQDAIKFPDLVHAVKPEPDRNFPQAASAHDTFWDFASLNPEINHMLMWVMSDRAIPRSFRMMEGFGVHTFRLINAEGEAVLCKFHWKPKLGMASVLWDEAVKISGAESDFQLKDLWEAIEAGDHPEWNLGLQIFTEEQAEGFDFDVLDPTKIVPEEDVPVELVGRLVLNRNPDNFFAETEQVAFCPSHVVPGIGFTNDPLLQGRLFSYLDTQLSRLGGPNFHELPINRPRCPFANDQRDGMHRHEVNRGRVAYDPSSLQADKPLESHRLGYETFPEPVSGDKLRERAERFADHYTQARMFWLSQTEPEQDHIVAAFTFELGMCDTPEIRVRMVGHLRNVDDGLARRVAEGLGIALPEPAEAARPTGKAKPSDALSILKNAGPPLPGKRLGVLVTDGVDARILRALREAVEAEGAQLVVVAPRRGGVTAKDGTALPADHAVAAGPSVLFDAVAILGEEAAMEPLTRNANAREFASDAFTHLKVIGFDAAGRTLLGAAGVPSGGDEGLVPLDESADARGFVARFAQLRIWKRAPGVMAQV